VVGGVLIIVFGLYIAGVLRIGVFGRYQQIQLRQKRRATWVRSWWE